MPLHSSSVGSSTSLRIACDSRWVMAYSAAVGLVDRRSFDTAFDGGVVAHPLFPVAPEWALLTKEADPFRLGLSRDERARGVHATHHLALHRPVRAGDDIELRAEVVGIEGLPSGALATIRFDASTVAGEPVWTTWMGTIHRGVDLLGSDVVAPGPAVMSRTAAGDSTSTVHHVGAGDAHVYTECARIWNPIHTDVAVARSAGLPDIILHGTASLATAVTAAMGAAGRAPGDVASVSGSFRAMVLMPSDVRLDIAPVAGGCAFTVVNDAGQPAVRDGLITFR